MKQSLDIKKLREENPNHIPKNPFEHQKDAFENLSKLFTFKDKNPASGILVLPTGAGKTFTAVNWICRNVLPKNAKVLWLAHTGHLLEQAFETFKHNILETPKRETINIRVVSSNPEHSKASDISPADDILIVTTQTAISNWNTDALDGKGQKRETAFEEFIKHSNDTKLFLILDEAHHAPAYGCRNLLIGNKNGKKGIRDVIPGLYLLGLTATPTYNDERRRGWLFEIFNTELFQKKGIIYEADKADLIKQNILALPEYIQKNTGEEVEVDDKTYNQLVREHKDLPEYVIEKLAKNSERNDYIVKEYVENRKKYGKTLIFADRWFQCVYIKEKLIKHGIKVDAVYTHIDATPGTAEERNKRTTNENSKILKNFKGNKIDVLINVKMLTEGTDVPSVNTVFVTRQTTSPILLTQMIGRALRGKKAGGGEDKDRANIVFFTDNWNPIINFATPEGGGTEETEPLVKGNYPVEYISLRLVEELCKKIDSGIVIAEVDYLEQIPVGWYETEVLIEVEEEINKFTEFVIVYEKTKEKFEKFIKEIPDKLDSDWEKEKLDEKWMKKYTQEWMNTYFEEIDNSGNTLDLDLIKIARHIAQSGISPVFYTFEERDRHDLTKIAKELINYNEFIIQEKLQSLYNDPSSLWKIFYKSYNRFKTAFDAEKNRVYHIIKFGNPPEPVIPTHLTESDDTELPEPEKEQVFRRDGYTCLCCGKTKKKGKRVKLEVDHIIPRKFGGKTTVENSQTLCSPCNKDKGVNEINFRIFSSPRQSPPDEFKSFTPPESEKADNALRRVVNMFYHCQAVSDLRIGIDGRNKKYYKVWEIELYKDNKPEWLIRKKDRLLDFIHNDLNCKFVEDVKIVSPGFISANEWNKKGQDLITLEKYEEAIKCFNRALEIDPEHVKTLDNKGIVLKKLGKNEEAIKHYNKALEISPEYITTWYNKAIILRHIGKNEEAIKSYDKALEIDPYFANALINKGTILDDLGKYEEAIKCYDRVLKNNPEHVSAWHNKGIALKKQGKPEEAIKCYDKALEINPSYELAKRGRYESLKLLNKAK